MTAQTAPDAIAQAAADIRAVDFSIAAKQGELREATGRRDGKAMAVLTRELADLKVGREHASTVAELLRTNLADQTRTKQLATGNAGIAKFEKTVGPEICKLAQEFREKIFSAGETLGRLKACIETGRDDLLDASRAISPRQTQQRLFLEHSHFDFDFPLRCILEKTGLQRIEDSLTADCLDTPFEQYFSVRVSELIQYAKNVRSPEEIEKAAA